VRQPLRIASIFAIALGVACAAYSSQSVASTIVAPIGATASTTFSSSSGNDYSILHTIDQSGLSAGYISGETDFDNYLAGNPTHTSLANGREWFSRDYGRRSVASQTITYAFSALTSINGFALWNEEFAGIGTTQLWWAAADGVFSLFDTIVPADNAFGSPNYSAQLFEFDDPISMLFFRLVILDCPGPPPRQSSYRGCGIGEVAFSADLGPVDNNPIVPLPAALPLFGSALGLFVRMGRRRRRYN
jgi:hypothetical protein